MTEEVRVQLISEPVASSRSSASGSKTLHSTA